MQIDATVAVDRPWSSLAWMVRSAAVGLRLRLARTVKVTDGRAEKDAMCEGARLDK